MNILKKTGKLLALVVAVMISTVAFADEVTFTASAPKTVVVGERFRITYKVNTRNYKEFRAPEMNGISILAGPSTSTSSEMVISNGNVTNSTTVTFTYTVVCEEAGEFTLDGATITAEKEKLKSNSLTIKVLPPDERPASSGQQRQGQSGGSSRQSQAQGGEVSSDELFMLATVDKTTVYEQEAILLSFKVYKSPSVNLSSLSTNMPDIKNCNVQEIELPQQHEFQLERYNGRNYATTLWSQYVLFPQQSGELEIPSTTFTGVVMQEVPSQDIFEMFFNAGRYVEVKKELPTKAVKINVKSLPSGKSSAYYGGVGDFSISSTISSTDVKANDAVTVKVVLSGTGNLKLVKTPEIKFPQDFDIYDPKVENKYTIKGGRQTGNKVFEYLVIPRHAGQYTIPAMEFQYFDTKSGEYRTLKTDEYQLNVAKGEGGDAQTSVSYVSKEDLKYVGQDVRFHATPSRLKQQDDLFFGSMPFYLCLALPVVLLLILVLLSRKRIADNANQAKVRVRKASSAASRRLKSARKLMNEGRKNEFYDEMMRALFGYVGDKLSIPVAELSRDNIEKSLREHNVTDTLIQNFKSLLDDCEFARFAPGDDSARMDRLYEQASDVIGQMENTIK